MTIYSEREAKQNLSSLLDQARKEGEVKIRRDDGKVFVLKTDSESFPDSNLAASPLDVGGVDTQITLADILDSIREGRKP